MEGERGTENVCANAAVEAAAAGLILVAVVGAAAAEGVGRDHCCEYIASRSVLQHSPWQCQCTRKLRCLREETGVDGLGVPFRGEVEVRHILVVDV